MLIFSPWFSLSVSQSSEVTKITVADTNNSIPGNKIKFLLINILLTVCLFNLICASEQQKSLYILHTSLEMNQDTDSVLETGDVILPTVCMPRII